MSIKTTDHPQSKPHANDKSFLSLESRENLHLHFSIIIECCRRQIGDALLLHNDTCSIKMFNYFIYLFI